MEMMTKEQAEEKKFQIRNEIQSCDVAVQAMQCTIAKHRADIAEVECKIEGMKLQKASLYATWEGIRENAACV